MKHLPRSEFRPVTCHVRVDRQNLIWQWKHGSSHAGHSFTRWGFRFNRALLSQRTHSQKTFNALLKSLDIVNHTHSLSLCLSLCNILRCIIIVSYVICTLQYYTMYRGPLSMQACMANYAWITYTNFKGTHSLHAASSRCSERVRE
jgi:hypothetical protein